MQNRNYLNNNNMQKGIALATCMAIVMGLFTGCGKKNDLQIAASPEEVQKGRYVETELSLPEEWKDKNISQIFRSGDELHFLVAGGSEGQVSLEEWMLGEGDALTEVTKDWLKVLPEGKDLESSDSFTLLQDAEGNQYLYGNCYRDEESSSAHLWKEADGSALDITPQKWLEPMDMDAKAPGIAGTCRSYSHTERTPSTQRKSEDNGNQNGSQADGWVPAALHKCVPGSDRKQKRGNED